MRAVENSTYVERRDAVAHDWTRFLGSHGVLPIFVPNTLSDPTAYFDAVAPQGLVLTGGEDLDSLEGPLAPRDRTETRLLGAAAERRIPVFGVCRGLHLINRYFGGIMSRIAEGGHVAQVHAISVEPQVPGIAASRRADVNSYHDWGVESGQLAPSLRSFATSDDGFVEGLYHPTLPIIAVQWHPERVNPSRDLDDNLFSRWLTA